MSEATEVSQTNFEERLVPLSHKIDNLFRDVQYGRIYDRLEPGQAINIAAFGNISIEIDEENLSLEKISLENLQKGWERVKEGFVTQCEELGIEIDPFEVYKYYQIQRKVFQVLGPPTENAVARTNRFAEQGNRVKLSETKGYAMCSEYAILATYIAQKIGEPIHLIIGSAAEAGDRDKYRGAHAYVWVDSLNAAFDSVLTSSDTEYPAIMKPVRPATLSTLEEGKDIEAQRIGSNFVRFYGMQAGGFGVELDHSEALGE